MSVVSLLLSATVWYLTFFTFGQLARPNHGSLLLLGSQYTTQSEYRLFDSDILYKLILAWLCMLQVVCKQGLAIIYLRYFYG